MKKILGLSTAVAIATALVGVCFAQVGAGSPQSTVSWLTAIPLPSLKQPIIATCKCTC